jgi:hypothetical protein
MNPPANDFLYLACQLASGAMLTETIRIFLRRGLLRPTPWFLLFDNSRQLLHKGWLWLDNRHPLQRLKRHCRPRGLILFVR